MGKFLIPIIILFATLYGCNSEGCLENGSAIPLAGFYSSSTEKQISLNILQIHGCDSPADNDSILVKTGENVSEVYLPMRSTRSSTMWALTYNQNGLKNPHDTINFEYESIPYFASEECGAMYYYRITNLNYTKNLIDSVTLTETLITNADIETIKIFFRTAAEGGSKK